MLLIRRVLTRCVLTLAAALALAGPVIAQPSGKPQYGAFGLDLTAMDQSVPPGQDFNRYASGAWLARTTIPPDKSIASLRLLMTDAVQTRLRTMCRAG